jgi:pyruvate dehydrogenase E2 component (dihydrolipoamide acetyltransferase)
MAVEIVIPRLGWSMEQGTFGQWLAQDGQRVERGQALFVLEGEKAAQDIEAIDSGVLRIPPDGPQPGDTVAVGQVIGYFIEPGEPAPFELSGVMPDPVVLPAANRLAAAAGQPLPAALGARTLAAAAAPHMAAGAQVEAEPLIKASPRARKAARQLGVDLRGVTATGCTGRIRERDVLAAAGRAASSVHNVLADQRAAVPCAAAPDEPGQLLPLSEIRRTIAQRMLAAAHGTAPVTLTARCNATNLVNLRGQFRAAAALGPVPGYTDFVVKLVACVLPHHQLMKAQWTAQGLFVPEACHIAVAVDTERGLMAPVIRHVERLSLRQVAVELADLAHQARQGTLAPSQMENGVLTVTNLGKYGIQSFTPILNLPQCATLGLGAVRPEPAFEQGQWVARDAMTLSLTFDHRVIDGAPAARFLQALVQAIENPGAYLV